jgi:hypothetical protein
MNRALLLVIGLVVCLLGFPDAAGSQVPAGSPTPAAPSGPVSPASPDGWVVLPLDEYHALRARGLPPAPPPTSAPVEATLTRVDYELRVDNDAIAGRALLTIDVLREGWARVQIPSGLMARDARVDGQPVPLVEGPPPQVFLSRAGRTVVTLEIAMSLATAGGTESVTLPPSAAPISRATLILPRSGVDLSVTGGFIAERGESPDESRWDVFGRPGQALILSWKRKVDDRRADQPLRTRARVITLVGLGEDVSQITASVRVDVVQGLARDVALTFPAGVAINQVNGSTVADWEASSGTLRVRLLDATGSEAEFIVQGELRVARDGEIPVPLVRVPAAERETGGVAIDIVGAGEVAGRQARGLEPADPSELGEIVAGRESPSMVAYRLRPLAGSEARSLSVAVVRYTPQAVLVANVEEARYRALAAEDGALLVEARYAVRNNQRSFLKVAMPPGAQVWSANVSGRPIRPGLAERDAVLLPLEKGRAGEAAPTFVIELMYLQRAIAWTQKGVAAIALPALDLPVSRTGLELHYSPRYRVALLAGPFRVEDDPGPVAEAFRPPPPPAGAPEASARRSVDALQQLADRFRSQSGGRVAVGALPVNVTFPVFGPSLFLAAELTAETRAPLVELSFKRATK